MTKLKITTKMTIKESLQAYAGLFSFSLGIIAGSAWAFKSCTMDSEDRVTEITSLLEKGDVTAAEHYFLAALKSKGLDDEDKATVGLEIERKKRIEQFTKALERWSFAEARKELDQLEDYNPSHSVIASLEQRLEEVTEERLFRKFSNQMSGNYNDLEITARKYLQLHPQGEHRQEVIQYWLAAACSSLQKYFYEDSFKTLMLGEIANVNALLLQYSREGIILTAINPDELLAAAKAYVEKPMVITGEKAKADGKKIRAIYHWIDEKGTVIKVGRFLPVAAEPSLEETPKSEFWQQALRMHDLLQNYQ